MRVMITGGVASGKSTLALELARAWPGEKLFVATAEPLDEEMRVRIAKHRRERGEGFRTVEESVAIDRHAGENVLVDCVTIWMNNLFHYQREGEWERILNAFLDGLGERAVIVTNEVGWGTIPENALARRYNRFLGGANRLIASRMDEVYLVVSGVPLRIKSRGTTP